MTASRIGRLSPKQLVAEVLLHLPLHRKYSTFLTYALGQLERRAPYSAPHLNYLERLDVARRGFFEEAQQQLRAPDGGDQSKDGIDREAPGGKGEEAGEGIASFFRRSTHSRWGAHNCRRVLKLSRASQTVSATASESDRAGHTGNLPSDVSRICHNMPQI